MVHQVSLEILSLLLIVMNGIDVSMIDLGGVCFRFFHQVLSFSPNT